jgi:tetratricopeptide (TPR) repeat protein
MANVKKRYPAEVLKRRTAILPVAVVCLALAGFLQSKIDPDAARFHAHEKLNEAAGGGLNNEFLLLPLLGFREAAAGLLWVRCDEFFHSGDYDAILPLVRLITWLDPHAENVYITGAWHLAYNFTDASERSDRRYIAPSQSLLEEGVENNMEIPDIKFELGWQRYDKIKDFAGAEEAFLKTDATTPNPKSDDYPYGAPLKTLHILAHAYEHEGRIPEALMTWKKALDRSTEMLKRKPNDYSSQSLHNAEVRNYNENLQRYHNRYTTSGHDEVNPSPYPQVLQPPPGSADKTPRPWDVALVTEARLVRPKVFKISGQFNSQDGARIDVRITDWDYQEHKINGSLKDFAVDPAQTILVDSISVRKNRFEREMDMSKDPKMYSFSEPAYRIVLSYNVRTTAPHLLDRFGWSGEGVTDADKSHVFMDTDPRKAGTTYIEGQGGTPPVWDGTTLPFPYHGQPVRLIRVTYKITKEQILNQKPITQKDIVSVQ